jgi:hypothetical protein
VQDEAQAAAADEPADPGARTADVEPEARVAPCTVGVATVKLRSAALRPGAGAPAGRYSSVRLNFLLSEALPTPASITVDFLDRRLQRLGSSVLSVQRTGNVNVTLPAGVPWQTAALVQVRQATACGSQVRLALPTSCRAIRQLTPTALRGSWFIDPNGPGDASVPMYEVDCTDASFALTSEAAVYSARASVDTDMQGRQYSLLALGRANCQPTAVYHLGTKLAATYWGDGPGCNLGAGEHVQSLDADAGVNDELYFVFDDGATPLPVGKDPYFANVVALYHMDGPVGARVNGDPSTGMTYSNFSAYGTFGASSAFADADDLGVKFPDGHVFDGDFTLEGWQNEFSVGLGGLAQGALYFGLPTDATNRRAVIQIGGGPRYQSTPVAWRGWGWTYVAVSRHAGEMRVYIDGRQVAFEPPASGGPTSSEWSVPIDFGATWVGNAPSPARFYGYFDDIRLTRGVARYTRPDMPVPTRPHPDL